MKTIRTRFKLEFGNERFYPVNEMAKIFCSVARCKSFTREQLVSLRSTGIKIEVEKVTETVEEVEVSDLE